MKKPLLLIILSSSLLLTACLGSFNQPPTPSPQPQQEVSQPQQTELSLTAETDGTLALELLEFQATVETQDFGEAGAFVTSINGLAGDSGHYWAFYVNGEYGQTGASQTILKAGDVIKFAYEEIDSAQF